MSYVLVVEDDTAIMSCVSDTLRDLGHKVLVAENGRIATRQIDNHKGRLKGLVTDQFMPNGLNGVDVAMYMRDAEPDIPIVIVSGGTGSISAEWAARHRVHLLAKPFTASALIDLLFPL